VTQQSASTSVGSRAQRASFALASLGWAYLAALHRSDYVRAGQLLVTFQREWNAFGGYVTDRQPEQIRTALRFLPIDGQWQTQTANALALASVPAEAQQFRTELVRTAGSAATGAAGAARFFAEHMLYLAPMGDEAIWAAYDQATSVGPMDVGSHLHDWVFNYSEGFDIGTERGVIDQLAAQSQTVDFGTQEPMQVTALAPRRGSGSYWPWLVGGAAVLTLGGVLAWRKWGKGRRR
jgi:hypothetical protein